MLGTRDMCTNVVHFVKQSSMTVALVCAHCVLSIRDAVRDLYGVCFCTKIVKSCNTLSVFLVMQ